MGSRSCSFILRAGLGGVVFPSLLSSFFSECRAGGGAICKMRRLDASARIRRPSASSTDSCPQNRGERVILHSRCLEHEQRGNHQVIMGAQLCGEKKIGGIRVGTIMGL